MPLYLYIIWWQHYSLIDKIIGRIYPVFGAILLLSAVGVFGGIFVKGYDLMNIDLTNGFTGLLRNFAACQLCAGPEPAGALPALY